MKSTMECTSDSTTTSLCSSPLSHTSSTPSFSQPPFVNHLFHSNSHHPRLQWHRHRLGFLVCNCNSNCLIPFCRSSSTLQPTSHHSALHNRLCPLHLIPVVFTLEVSYAFPHCTSEYPVFTGDVFLDLMMNSMSISVCMTDQTSVSLQKKKGRKMKRERKERGLRMMEKWETNDILPQRWNQLTPRDPLQKHVIPRPAKIHQ